MTVKRPSYLNHWAELESEIQAPNTDACRYEALIFYYNPISFDWESGFRRCDKKPRWPDRNYRFCSHKTDVKRKRFTIPQVMLNARPAPTLPHQG
jgi:hypothetical protein